MDCLWGLSGLFGVMGVGAVLVFRVVGGDWY